MGGVLDFIAVLALHSPRRWKLIEFISVVITYPLQNSVSNKDINRVRKTAIVLPHRGVNGNRYPFDLFHGGGFKLRWPVKRSGMGNMEPGAGVPGGLGEGQDRFLALSFAGARAGGVITYHPAFNITC